MRVYTPEERLQGGIRDNKLEKVLLALADGADPNAMPKGHTHSLFSQAIHGKEEIVLAMLEHGANPNILIGKGSHPLFFATNQSRPKLLTMLLDFGADPSMQRRRGKHVMDTALHEAVGAHRRDYIIELLEAGADPLIPDGRNGKIPLERATFKQGALYDKIQYHMKLPRLVEDEPITKAALLAENDEGYRPLDNPVVWRQWDRISEALHARGESFSKDELLSASPKGVLPARVAIESRQFGLVLEGLRAQGEMLYADDFALFPELHDKLLKPYVLHTMLEDDNLHALGSWGFQNLLSYLPDAIKEALPNRHTMMANLSRAERAQQRAVG